MKYSQENPICYIGNFESEVFGFPIARSEVYNLVQVKEAISYAKSKKVDLLIIRCPTTALDVIHYLESLGALLMDTFLKFLIRKKNAETLKCNSGIKIVPIRIGDEPFISEIAKSSFRAIPTHFYADKRLPVSKCDNFYSLWALNSVSNKNNHTFIAIDQGTIIGFVITTFLNKNTMDGILLGVKQSQFNGYYVLKALILQGIAYGLKNGVKKFQIKSTLNNFSMYKICETMGFKLFKSKHTFHYWLT